ncbi:hypothetical protein FSP39_000796 [Pinctada imbricata]|uniref:THO complex subunit 6-like protein n=1 Tax=Pinctada imbricata TaxID=66713 RepID=A0AA88XIU3_PINIB|nr:hypothetical protein FSP39_000796 [Pinctada imbricata]
MGPDPIPKLLKKNHWTIAQTARVRVPERAPANYSTAYFLTKDRSLPARKLLHTTVFAQCFSPCGKYLAAANNYGKIAIFSLSTALSPEGSEATWKPIFSFQASEDGAIFTLSSTDALLISAGNGPICAWKWADILAKGPKLIWSLNIPKKGPFSNPEVNTLQIDEQESQTYVLAGCGDKNIYGWDISSGKQIFQLSGHTDYIHDLAVKKNNSLYASASEDGTVRLWGRCGCVRPELGSWLGCVAIESNDDWLVCGGGPRMSVWHLRSMSCTTVLDTPKATMKTVQFYEDSIISAGSQPFVHHWFMNGEQKAKVPCSPTSVFNIAVNTKSENHRVLCVGGNSSKIDVSTNFGYKAFSLTFTLD